jgi:hypothetical protein
MMAKSGFEVLASHCKRPEDVTKKLVLAMGLPAI